jgi:hypothetical protein
MVRVATVRVLLVMMAPWADTVGAVSSSLVCSCGGVGAVDVQEPDVEEPNGEEPYVEEPFHFLPSCSSSCLCFLQCSSLRPLLKG